MSRSCFCKSLQDTTHFCSDTLLDLPALSSQTQSKFGSSTGLRGNDKVSFEVHLCFGVSGRTLVFSCAIYRVNIGASSGALPGVLAVTVPSFVCGFFCAPRAAMPTR
ncbi:unnamed protein product [Pylaiella littoralis]